MKNGIKRMAAVVAAGAALAVGAALTQGAALATLTYDWGFGTSSTPVAPDSSGGGAAQAAVAPGALADGWLDSSAILGSAQGIWDLGQAGTITLNNPNGFGGVSGAAQLITVRVTQFQGGVYSQVGQVS